MKKISGFRLILLVGLLSVTPSIITAQEILLWPNGAPGSEGKTGKEKVRIHENGEHIISGVHKPSITVYLPAAGKATGAAIIIAPGGGHREIWSDHEGHTPARWLSERGIAAFVLKYRLAREENSTYTVDEHELGDMQRAIRLVRSRAREWGIDTARIGVMGSSAGGEIAALAAMRFDNGNASATDPVEKFSSRPAFQVLIYPGNSQRFEVNSATPPAFIVGGFNDRESIAIGMAKLYIKYRESGIPAELHIYATAGHGFGMRASSHDAASKWPQRLVEWLNDVHLLKK